MSPGLIKMLYTNHIYLIHMYLQDLALNDLQGLKCHKKLKPLHPLDIGFNFNFRLVYGLRQFRENKFGFFV